MNNEICFCYNKERKRKHPGKIMSNFMGNAKNYVIFI